jgi:hypothetical protein
VNTYRLLRRYEVIHLCSFVGNFVLVLAMPKGFDVLVALLGALGGYSLLEWVHLQYFYADIKDSTGREWDALRLERYLVVRTKAPKGSFFPLEYAGTYNLVLNADGKLVESQEDAICFWGPFAVTRLAMFCLRHDFLIEAPW